MYVDKSSFTPLEQLLDDKELTKLRENPNLAVFQVAPSKTPLNPALRKKSKKMNIFNHAAREISRLHAESSYNNGLEVMAGRRGNLECESTNWDLERCVISH